MGTKDSHKGTGKRIRVRSLHEAVPETADLRGGPPGAIEVILPLYQNVFFQSPLNHCPGFTYYYVTVQRSGYDMNHPTKHRKGGFEE